ncbi:stage 0 sporulation protein, partial [Bacillus sp. B-TM1]
MYDVVGVRFKKAGKVYYFDPNQFNTSYRFYNYKLIFRDIE